jgi:hypothetical protein
LTRDTKRSQNMLVGRIAIQLLCLVTALCLLPFTLLVDTCDMLMWMCGLPKYTRSRGKKLLLFVCCLMLLSIYVPTLIWRAREAMSFFVMNVRTQPITTTCSTPNNTMGEWAQVICHCGYAWFYLCRACISSIRHLMVASSLALDCMPVLFPCVLLVLFIHFHATL